MLRLPALYEGVHRVRPELADLVGDLQSFLYGKGFKLAVDEAFGPKTHAVVVSYQLRRGLVGDGRVGPATWGTLLKEGFRPKSYMPEAEGYAPERSPNYPPKPPGATSPNGKQLFGHGLTYVAAPTDLNPEGVKLDQIWVKQNIGLVLIPQLKGIPGAISGEVMFNKRLIPQLQRLFQIWEQEGLLRNIKTWSGGWVPRFIRGRIGVLSNHAYGSAFDINAAWNGYKSEPALAGRAGSVRELVPMAYELGFYWGGWYNDGMHFEAYKVVEV